MSGSRGEEAWFRTSRGEPALPRLFGRFRLLEVIGAGGMGVVYLAEDPELGRRVALKLIRADLLHDAKARSRFRREVEVLARLDHPHLCTIHEAGETEGQPWIAMRFVAGQSLRQALSSEAEAMPAERRSALAARPRLERWLAVFEAASRAVHHAHESGLVHRDLKPGNLMLEPSGDVVVVDFGLARDEAETTGLTASGDDLGTLAYMAPEQVEPGGRRVDRRTDVYALGVALYETLTLELPYEAETAAEIERAITGGVRRPARRLVPRLPPELDWVLDRALDVDPVRRYQTALAFAEDLRRMRRREPVVARRQSTTLRLRRWTQRNPTATALTVVLGLALVSSLVLLWRGDRALAASRYHAAQSQARLADYQRMRDVPLVDDLLTEAEWLLWPAHPDRIQAMDDWLARARAAAGRAFGHRAILSQVRSRALPVRPEVERRASALAGLGRELEAIRQKGEPARTGVACPLELQSLAYEVDGELSDLERALEAARWRFADSEDGLLHATFGDLVAKLDRLTQPEGVLADVERRRHRAATLEARSLAGAKVAWEHAIARLARNPRYRGMPALRPQIGLVPLGPDPTSELEEFALLDTGAVPSRDATGRLTIDGESAIVFVLLPPGTFRMGAQSSDPGQPNYDPCADGLEEPVHEVTLEAFFIAKYEMTQGQWQRVMGSNPSVYHPGLTLAVTPVLFTLEHPVETMPVELAGHAMQRLGCVLPTEQQWEYAARGGTSMPWWTGSAPSALQGAANVNDRVAQEVSAGTGRGDLDFEDGHVIHAAVGSYRPNGFGLHDVAGNVAEWCGNRFYLYDNPDDAEMRDWQVSVARGGSWASPAVLARSAAREICQPGVFTDHHGLRPARRLD